MEDIEPQIFRIMKNNNIDSSTKNREIRTIINKNIQNINIDSISLLSTCINVSHQCDLIIPVLNYLFENNIENNIRYCKIDGIYNNSCLYNNIYILENIVLYCFKYNCQFCFTYDIDRMYFHVCCCGYFDISHYLIAINKKYYNTRFRFYPHIRLNNTEINNLCKSLKYLFHTKQIKSNLSKLDCYIFNNNIVDVHDSYFRIFDSVYTFNIYHN